MYFRERLKLIRETFSVSQVQLADDIGVQQYHVAKWEAGKYDPNPDIKRKIADYFSVSPLWLEGLDKHAFTGVVFIPEHFFKVLRGKRPYIIYEKILEFLCKDGAKSTDFIANTDGKPRGGILFARGNELLLFLPFFSYRENPDSYSLRHEMFSLTSSYDLGKISEKGGTNKVGDVMHHNLSWHELSQINQHTPLEEIEKLLNISIPGNLKAIHTEVIKISASTATKKISNDLISQKPQIIECHDNTWHLLELSTKEFEKGWVKKIIVFTFFDVNVPDEPLQHGIMLNGDEVTKVISHCVFRSGYIGSGPKSFQEFIQQSKAHQIPIGEILVDSESAAMILKGEIPKIDSLNIDYSVDFIEKYFTGKLKTRNPLEDPILSELIQTLEPLIDLPDDNKRFAVTAITHFVKGFLQKG